ncbi:unnamed protein product [Bathycoccus prasinos]
MASQAMSQVMQTKVFGAKKNIANRSNVRSSAPTRKVALRSTKIFAQKAMDFGSLRGEYQPYEGGAVDLNQILEERDACGVGVIASLKGERTHKCVDDSLSALGCMEHRGACSADNDSGDGAGIMTQIPWQMLSKWCAANGISGFSEESSAVSMTFLPTDKGKRTKAKAELEKAIAAEGLKVLGWRDVPTKNDIVGPMAKITQPAIEQCLIDGAGATGDELERKLYFARKNAEKVRLGNMADLEDMYVCTMSCRTIVYKGMLRSAVVGQFFLDLQDKDYVSSFSIYHRRFSTNTTPKWPLAQPMRFLGHNGEINTLQGNLNWMASNEAKMTNAIWGGREQEFRPLCDPAASDSANLDRVAELLVKTGREPEETMMLLVPEAFRNHPDLEATVPEAKNFYQYYSGIMEAWDGPALLVFSDGKKVGCRLDRNGLRPARFWQTSDDYIYVASEVGVLNDIMSNAPNVVKKGRLGPGTMICVDLENGTFKENEEISKEVSSTRPYGKWLNNIHRLKSCPPLPEPTMDDVSFIESQARAGYASEDVSMIVESMAQEGIEPTWSMGDDTPVPVISSRPRLLYDYFKQRFAQVTNPAIDPLREGLVMSLETTLGAKGNLLDVSSGRRAGSFFVESTATIKARYTNGAGGLKAGLDKLCQECAEAVQKGSECIVITDKPDEGPDSPAIPSLLAVGAVHHHLIKVGLRSKASIVVESASAFSTHHFAVLIGYGASAVCPWLALETARKWRSSTKVEKQMSTGKLPLMSQQDVQRNLKNAINKGLKKILSKMGISLITSYHGAQIFEAYGIGPELIDVAFKGTVSRIGGLTLDELAAETKMFVDSAFPGESETMDKLKISGMYQVKPNGEYHGNNQEMSKLLHKAIGLGGDAPDAESYKLYEEHRNTRPATCLRDRLDIKSDRKPIDISEVESAADIASRFCTGGMSLGAISQECHEAIAVAMNRIGGKSNSGEGGEDPKRFIPISDAKSDGSTDSFPYLRGLKNGDVASSAIKQVASGRFGVTTSFLMSSNQHEIKVAQGAKPGEGGQLPGKKVSPYIAWLRKSKAGVPLISPPPHHDIYSIEDLAQLIFDLHAVNPEAKVSVKLVGQAGIGTVASGVAKANADIIQISGGDGGTGASPLSSIKHCGGPVELGLVESHRTLVENGLRERVVLRADGGCRSGLDVMQWALMGADEFGFGTVAMIATGCVMARICHTNNCPVGVATQREELRARFPGAPSDLVNFFIFAAEEVRVILAEMGYKSLDEVIGRNDLLKQKEQNDPKTNHLDLSLLTTSSGKAGSSKARINQKVHDDGELLDDILLADAGVKKCIETQGTHTVSSKIVNVDRAAMARIAGNIASKYGDDGFKGKLTIKLEGAGGQSFGAFVVGGMDVQLVGEANDYVCKSISGGTVSIMPPPGAGFKAEDSTIAGNTCLYGATGGKIFINGRAGERFAVRNSLGQTVVEGCGDHACEYMTGGVVVCLGRVGRNVGAGMTGGIGYFLDEDNTFESKVNGEIVVMQRISTEAGEKQCKDLISEHVEKTGSPKGKAILADWANMKEQFWQIVPPSEAQTPEACNAEVGAVQVAR